MHSTGKELESIISERRTRQREMGSRKEMTLIQYVLYFNMCGGTQPCTLAHVHPRAAICSRLTLKDADVPDVPGVLAVCF